MEWFEMYVGIFITIAAIVIVASLALHTIKHDPFQHRDKKEFFQTLEHHGIYSLEQFAERISETPFENWEYRPIRNLDLFLFEEKTHEVHVRYDMYGYPSKGKLTISFKDNICAVIDFKTTQVPFEIELTSSWWKEQEVDVRHPIWRTLHKQLKVMTTEKEVTHTEALRV